tara:strand:+ start:668 stop:868 length:201 start_codon:yes stop_codon:yes gene_type:complete
MVVDLESRVRIHQHYLELGLTDKANSLLSKALHMSAGYVTVKSPYAIKVHKTAMKMLKSHLTHNKS